MKDYTKICPILSKYIAKGIIDADTSITETSIVSKPSLTKKKVEDVYEYLKWLGMNFIPAEIDKKYIGKGIGQIATAVGLTKEQVQSLHKEFLAYKNWSKPEPEIIK